MGTDRNAIGETLQKAREVKKLTLEAVASATRINIHILQNIEEGALEKLPGELYVKSFLRQYATFLGMDAGPILEQYRQVSTQFRKTPPPLPQPQETALKIPIQEWLSRLRKREMKRVFIVAGVFLAAVGLWRALSTFEKRVAELKEAKRLPKAIISPTPQQLSIPKNVPLEVTLRAIEPTWIQAKVDDVVVFQNILGKDSFEVWRPKQKAELWVGNAGNVEVLLNGRLLGKPGKKGRVMKGILLSREGMRVPAP